MLSTAFNKRFDVSSCPKISAISIKSGPAPSPVKTRRKGCIKVPIFTPFSAAKAFNFSLSAAPLKFSTVKTWAANVDRASVNYIISTNDGANVSLVREALINQEGVLSVNITPYTPTTSQLSIVFIKPVNMDVLWDYFNRAHIIYFSTPDGLNYHIKDLKGWLADRLYK